MTRPNIYRSPKGLTLSAFLNILHQRGWRSYFDLERVSHYRLRGETIDGPAASKSAQAKTDRTWVTSFSALPTPAVEALAAELRFTSRPDPRSYLYEEEAADLEPAV